MNKTDRQVPGHKSRKLMLCLMNGWVDRQMYKGLNAHSGESNSRLRLDIIEYVLRVHVSS